MLSVLVRTLGCKLNQLESESYIDAFRQAGFEILFTSAGTSGTASSGRHPSLIIVNTCTVTSKADQKARRVIRSALRDFPNSVVIVTGCYAKLNQTDIKEIDNSGRLFVMKKEIILDLPHYFSRNKNHRITRINSSEILDFIKYSHPAATFDDQKTFQFSPEKFSSRTRSFLKIQDGCNNVCTYCRIRLARGSSVSLPAEQVLERLRLLEQNYTEAVLTGVNICQYSSVSSAPSCLCELLKYLLSGTEKIALRLSSLEPECINENFAQIISDKRVRPHFHLSVQSGSRKILEKMGRSYDAQIVEKAAALLRSAKDDPFLACDIITGFPGETEAEFEETLSLCKKIGFAWIHVFPYSKRPGTPAYYFSGAVQEIEVLKRVKILTDMAKQGRAEYVRRWLDREVDVLVEKKEKREKRKEKRETENRDCSRGLSENYLKVLIRYQGDMPPLPGTVLRCVLTEGCPAPEDCDAIAQEIPAM